MDVYILIKEDLRMFINRNSNISKALSIFKVGRVSRHRKDKQGSSSNYSKINFVADDIIESQYITRNFQIGVTYVQIAKSTLSQVKETLLEMKMLFDKCQNESNTSFGRESLNFKFEQLCKKFNTDSSKLTLDIRQNLFYNNNNELVFKVFDSSSLDSCILIPKLDPSKLNLKDINIKNEINAEEAKTKMEETWKYILASEKAIKASEEKLSKVNLTDIMSANLVALSSNENKESIELLIKLTQKGLLKDSNTYLKNLNKSQIDDLLK